MQQQRGGYVPMQVEMGQIGNPMIPSNNPQVNQNYRNQVMGSPQQPQYGGQPQQQQQYGQQQYGGAPPMMQPQGFPPAQPMGQNQSYMMAPQAQGQYIQQGTPVMVINNMRGENAFQKLSCPAVYVKQKFELMEALTGCETQNKYEILTASLQPHKKAKKKIFKAKEKSGWCERNCLNGNCRPFKIHISHDSHGDNDNDGDLFLLLDRPCACTYLCLNRPKMSVTIIEGGTKYMGKIVNTFDCCNDDSGNTKFTLKGPLCQMGFYRHPLQVCAEICQEAYFFLYDPSGTKVGAIEKHGKQCKSVIGDSDNFLVVFPVFATLQDRALIMSLALMLDFCFFEDNGGKQNNGTITVNI